MGCLDPARKGNASGSNSLPPRPRIQPLPIAAMHQPEERQKPRPSTTPLVHRIGVMRGIIEQARIERADAIALVIKRPRLAVGTRGDEVAILGIEEKHEPEQNGQQPFIKMLGPARRQSFDPRPISGMKTTKQLMQARPVPARRASSRLPPARRGSL